MKKWILLNNTKIKKIDEIIDILLENRGVKTKKEKEKFLNPSLNDLKINLTGIDRSELFKAYQRIKKAIKNQESIVVYTDYDVDGICAGAIVWETIYKIYKKIMPYVPDRKKEGYGFSKIGLDYIKKEYNASLVIAVDHGISSIKEINYAKKIGIDSIIIDHHVPSSKLPEPFSLVHTTKLSAGGIAWFFSQYLNSKLTYSSSSFENLDLAALATIADLTPLIGLSRVIVKYGLIELNRTKRLGLSVLIKESGLKKGQIGVYEVGHILAPRINAAGRIDHALDALRLICTNNIKKANLLAKRLNTINRERQILTSDSTLLASELVKRKKIGKLIMVEHESFNEGIIGLIAGKLVEEFYRPAIVISLGKEYSKASARSINGFNIVETIRKTSSLLMNVGGHPMAAGFTVATKNLKLLSEKLNSIVEGELDEKKLEKIIKIDLEINLSTLSQKFYDFLEKLSPFGVGNSVPVFASRKVKVINVSFLGKDNKHLKLVFDNKIKAIGFGMGEIFYKLSPGSFVDIAYILELNKWNDQTSLQLVLKDVKIG